jgi:hypothetical protein
MAKTTLLADARGHLYYNEGWWEDANLYILVYVDKCNGQCIYTDELFYVTKEELAKMTKVIVDMVKA